MVLFSQAIADFLKCRVKDLRDQLNHPEIRKKVSLKFFGCNLTTTYKDRNCEKHTFSFTEITEKGADVLPAYGKLRKVYNITVTQHFYANHGIKLLFPYHHCAVKKFTNGENYYYPLELLELDINEIGMRTFLPTKIFQPTKSKESSNKSNSPKLIIDESKEDDDIQSHDWGRNLFTQRW